MISGSGIKVVAESVSARLSRPRVDSSFVAASPLSITLPHSFASSVAASLRASHVVVPILLSEAAAFALAAGSGKIPAFLFTVVRALLTF
jgi:hypothetical protein